MIARDEQPATGDPQAATIRAMFRLRETVVRLGALRDRIGAALDGRPAPAFSIVLIGPMLWTRFEPSGAALGMTAHAAGPASEDVVVVTDEPVVAALLDGRLAPHQARALGLVRLYGAQERANDVASLLDRLAPAANASLAGIGQGAGKQIP